ncbi:MAG: amino acid carrier protein [Chitinivibrionales bacterium]|nr:amino acid carrier protein [Chitinivibrionales bacterium]MBD3394355.1 amino acid carrier protein [Chitinivibrionales bacterium]
MSIAGIISTVDGFIWGPPLMVLLVGTGLYLTFLLRFIQVRGFTHALGVIAGKFDSPDDPGEINHFQALAAALSATIGTGNIVGVAAAILMGGPGAVFWMWVTAVVGMATKFTSCTLAVHFRRIDEGGEAHGGPMHFIEQGMGPGFKWLAVLFAVFTMVASFGIGNMFQINNIAVSLRTLLLGEGAPKSLGFDLTAGLAVAAMVALVIIGGIRSIGRFAAKIVPFMSLFYVGAGTLILLINISRVPEAFQTIFYHAFHTPEAVSGGLLGTVIRFGVARGLFSNEAGLGSAAMAHGAAKTKEPVREGLVAMMGPFIDTIIVCSITALVIITTKAYIVCDVEGVLTSRAFETGLGSSLGGELVSIGIVLFAFSTLVSWSYYGDRAVDYLFGRKAVMWYRIVYCGFIVLGACITIGTVIDFSDAMNGLMALPNLIALVALSPLVARLVKDYARRHLRN